MKNIYIISPNGSGPRFASEADAVLDRLAANGASLSDVVLETYDVQRSDAASTVGSEQQSDSVAEVVLRLLPKLPR